MRITIVIIDFFLGLKLSIDHRAVTMTTLSTTHNFGFIGGKKESWFLTMTDLRYGLTLFYTLRMYTHCSTFGTENTVRW
jgi:hypothetical protein